MRSIPQAMTWELLSRNRWSLLAGALGSVAFPAMLLAALLREGALDPQDGGLRGFLIMIHMVMVQLNVMFFGFVILGGQWNMSRAYAAPATSATLVAWRLLPAMALIAVETALWTALLNAAFHLGWPCWGPALFSAVALAAVTAAVWWGQRSAWMIGSLSLVGVVLGLWYKTRYGALTGLPTQYWNEVTPGEILTLAGFGLVSYGWAVAGMKRNRRGEAPLSIGFIAGVEGLFNRNRTPATRFASPAHAQLWHDWRRKGAVMPGVVVLGLLAGIVLWIFSSRRAEDLLYGMLVGGFMISGVGVLGGLVLGSPGAARQDTAWGSFLATRPMTTKNLAACLIRTAVKSVAIVWCLWAVAALVAYGLVIALLGRPLLMDADDYSRKTFWLLYVPATVLGPWIGATAFAAPVLTGRDRFMAKIACGGLAAFIGAILFSKFTLDPEAQDVFGKWLTGVSGAALVAMVAWTFAAALRRGLVTPGVAWTAAGCWAVGSVWATLAAKTPEAGEIPGALLLAGLLSLAVVPWASFPLALHFNRVR